MSQNKETTEKKEKIFILINLLRKLHEKTQNQTVFIAER
jgi:hypothetical protein